MPGSKAPWEFIQFLSTWTATISAKNKYKHSFKAVTLTGEIFNIGGSITGGEHKNSLGGMQRAAEIDTLTKKQDSLNKEKEEKNEALKILVNECEAIIKNIDAKEEEKRELNSKCHWWKLEICAHNRHNVRRKI